MKKYLSILSAVAVLPLIPLSLSAQFLEVDSALLIENGASGIPSGTLQRGFGYSVANLGLFDGDSIDDMIVGNPWDKTDAGALSDYSHGAVFLAMLNADGSVKTYSKLADGLSGMPDGSIPRYYTFGYSVCAIGDIDGDGVPDIAVGAPNGNSTGVYSYGDLSGVVYIIRLNSDGTVKGYQVLAEGVGGIPANIFSNRAYFGRSIANMGDLDGDGISDIVVGAEGWGSPDSGISSIPAYSGAIFFVYLNSDGTAKDFRQVGGDFGSSELEAFYASFEGQGLAGSVAAIGDLNKDGNPDLAASLDHDDDGYVDVFFLNADQSIQSTARIGYGIGGLTSDDIERYSSLCVADFVDFDGDGNRDLLLGNLQDSTYEGTDAGESYGAVHVALMNADGSVKDIEKFADGLSGFPSGVVGSFERFGGSLANMVYSDDGSSLPYLVVGESDRFGGGGVWMVKLSYTGEPPVTGGGSTTTEPEPSNPTPVGETRIETRYYYANTIARLSYDLDEDDFLGSGASFSGAMPGSLTIAGDVLQGFISPVGNYTFQVTGTDGVDTLILTVTIEVMEPTLTPVITGITLNGVYHATTVITPPTHGEAAVMAHFVASVNAGEALTMEFQWDQIKGSDGFTIVGGSLPDGLVLDRETGVITGVPTTAGVYEFLISVKDWRGRGYQWVQLTAE